MKNKKKISFLFVVLLILLGSNISFADTGVVNTPALRIREKASKDANILTRVYEDEEVEILGEEGDWYKVTANGKTGYASKSLINKKETAKTQNTVSNYTVEETSKENKTENNNVAENSQAENQETPKAEDTAETENVSKTVISEDTVARILPNFGSNEAILLTKDTEIEVVRDFNNWTEILVNNEKLWILKNKVTASTTTVHASSEEQKPAEPENRVEENKVENTTADTNTNTAVQNTTNNDVSTNTTNTVATDTRNTKGIINVETANVREKADKSSKIVARLDEDDEVTIVGEEGDWYKITSKKVESGYISKSLVKVSTVSSRSLTETREEKLETQAVNKGSDVANYAKQYIGVKYVVGGKTPESGFDCSGFTRYVFLNFGYSLGTVAADQNELGTEISRNDLQEGDLILFYNEEKTKIGHTGIYIGNNEFVHAANPDRGVVVDNLSTNSYYSTRFITAKRIVE